MQSVDTYITISNTADRTRGKERNIPMTRSPYEYSQVTYYVQTIHSVSYTHLDVYKRQATRRIKLSFPLELLRL